LLRHILRYSQDDRLAMTIILIMKRPNLYDRLKVTAIITMIIDHLWYTFFPEISWLRLVGRIAFPIFLFLVGFNWNYKWRRDLLWYAIAVQIPIFILWYGFHYRQPTLDILFGIIIWRIIVWLVDYGLKIADWKSNFLNTLYLILFTIILLILNPYLMKVLDYWSFVILFPILGYLFSKYYKHWIFNLLYSIFIFAVFLWFTQWVFNFDLTYFVVLIIFFLLLLCIFFILWQGNRFLPVGEKFDKIIIRISKKALYIYVFHLLLFGVIKIIMLVT